LKFIFPNKIKKYLILIDIKKEKTLERIKK